MTTSSRTPARAALAAGALLLLCACGSEGDDGAADVSPASTPPTTASAATSADPMTGAAADPATDPTTAPTTEPAADPTTDPEPQLIPYAGGESIGVEVVKPADASRLTGSPADFQQFIADSVQELIDAGDCTGEAARGITVEAVRTDGYAVGGVNECGGYQALWAKVDGSWQEIDGTQDTWDCAILKQFTVPSDIAGDSCYDYHGDHRGHRYHQA